MKPKPRILIAIVAFLSVLFGACSRSPGSKPAADATSDDGKARAELADQLTDSATLVDQFKDKLPDALTKKARCVAVVPSMWKGGLIVGARHGTGFVVCRTAAGDWSSPAPITVSGGTAGAQIGVESSDVLMLVMTDEGMRKLARAEFELGADVSATAGPVGRGREVDTDPTLHSEVLVYVRSRGLFAGAEIGGAVVKQDHEATRALYGADPDLGSLLTGEVPTPATAHPLVESVRGTMK